MEPFTEQGLVRVVVETPIGSRNKDDWQADLGIYRMSKVVPQGHVYLSDFGFVPGARRLR